MFIKFYIVFIEFYSVSETLCISLIGIVFLIMDRDCTLFFSNSDLHKYFNLHCRYNNLGKKYPEQIKIKVK